MLPAETVTAAFRLILGREPESEAALEHHRRMASERELRRALLRSREFATVYAHMEAEALLGASALAALEKQSEEDRTKHADERPGTQPLKLARGILPRQGPVETAADGEAGARLWSRVRAAWERLGREAAHWSVLTHEAFRPGAIEENRADWELSGEVEGVLVDAAMERVPGWDPAAMHCLEIGCGVGRATRALARRFGRMTAVDISLPHLAVAETELTAAGISNVALAQAKSVEDYARLAGGVDFLFTRLVLQHNPPPVQAAILSAALAGIAPGGGALFQVVTYGRHYEYATAADGGTEAKGMEMHVLPQGEVFRLIAAAGMAPLEVQEDFAAGRDGPFRSHLFLAWRPHGGAEAPAGPAAG